METLNESLPEFLQSWPFLAVYLFMLFGATARGQAVYWIARTVTQQALNRTHPVEGWRLRAHRWLQGEGTAKGIETVRTWGLPAVTFCQLTVGFQTMVLAGAGVLRIPWWKYTLAQMPGSMAWAFIYSTIGFAAWGAIIAAAAGSPVGLIALLGGIVVIAATFMLHRLRTKAKRQAAAREAEARCPVAGAGGGVGDGVGGGAGGAGPAAAADMPAGTGTAAAPVTPAGTGTTAAPVTPAADA